jgi:hypothetical protein
MTGTVGKLVTASALAVFLTATASDAYASTMPAPAVKQSLPEAPGTGTALGPAPGPAAAAAPSEAPALIPSAVPVCPCGIAEPITTPGALVAGLLAPFLHHVSLPEAPGTGQAAGVPGAASEAPVPDSPPCPCGLPAR